MRLIYLQTDKPYLNTAAGLGVRNVGSPVKFVSEAVPLPMAATANLSYAVVNTQDHNVKLATQAEVPLSAADISNWSVGIGVEYVFANLAYARVGLQHQPDHLGLRRDLGGTGRSPRGRVHRVCSGLRLQAAGGLRLPALHRRHDQLLIV